MMWGHCINQTNQDYIYLLVGVRSTESLYIKMINSLRINRWGYFASDGFQEIKSIF